MTEESKTIVDAASVCQRYNESATPGLKVEFERRLVERFGVTPQGAIPPEEVKRIWDEVFNVQGPVNMGMSSPQKSGSTPDTLGQTQNIINAIRTVCEIISEDDDEVGFRVYMPSWKIVERQTQFVNAMEVLRNYVGMQTEPKRGRTTTKPDKESVKWRQ